MSSFPPPPGDPNRPGYSPYTQNTTAYNREVWKAQRRAAKQQEKWARQQAKLQRRLMQPRSIVGPLILLALGVLFLLAQTGKISWANIAMWYARWWPLVLVLAGVLLVTEWALDQRAHAAGQQYRGRTVGGGIIFLLILLAVFGLGSREAYKHWNWGNGQYGFTFPNIDLALGEPHDFDDSMNFAAPDGASLLIRNPQGDVTVTGSSDDDQVHVSVHKEVHAHSDEAASAKEEKMQPKLTTSGKSLTLDVLSMEGGKADLTLQVPRNLAVTVNSVSGDIEIDQLHGDVSVSSGKGDVTLSAITGAVSAHINSTHSSFSAHSVTGPVNMDGNVGDVNVTDITGHVSLSGDFFGDTHAEHINGPLDFHSSRTGFGVARLDGSLDLDSDTLNADQMLGPVQLYTKYGKDITLDRVQGDTSVANNGKGSVSITTTTPSAGVKIVNHNGNVDLGLPDHTGFTLDATTNGGDIENDFNLNNEKVNGKSFINGAVNGGGPRISITTNNGDVTVRKAMVAPLPPLPPMPKLSMAPATKGAVPSSVAPPAKPTKPALPPKTPLPAKPAAPAAPPHSGDF
jgi:hypothetical protein